MGNTSDKEDNSETSSSNTPSTQRKTSQQVKHQTTSTNNKLSNMQKDLIRQTWDSSKRYEICVRIYKRVFEKRPEMKQVFESMGEDLWMDEARIFGEFLDSIVVGKLDDFQEIERLSLEMGRRHGEWRSFGFKSEFWVIFAEAMTTECVYLDAGAHPTGDVLGAWSTLVTYIFGWTRDGYYEKMKMQRKLSRKASRGGAVNTPNKNYSLSRTNSVDENGTMYGDGSASSGSSNNVQSARRSPQVSSRRL